MVNQNNKKRIIFFDSGPIISLVMSRLIWILPELKKKIDGKFYITPAVKKELIERPLNTKRFEFEAMQVLKLINENVLEVYDKIPSQKIKQLITLANNSFSINNKYIDIIQSGEMESVASALETDADAIVMDERTLRLFIENSSEMTHLLKIRFHKDINANPENIKNFTQQLSKIKIIRSVELIAIAYKMGMLDSYISKEIKNGKEILLDSVLWAAKTNGCAATGEEIEQIKKYLL